MDAPPETSASTKVKTAKLLKINIRSALAKASPKKKKSKWNDQPNCAFLQLPGELRNQIYDLVLVRDKNEDNSTESERIELRTLKRPALTATCRQIQSESLSYFFRHESFKYTFILDGHAKLSYKVNSKTLKWLKVANIKDLTIYDLTFGAQLPDVDGPYDSKDMPLRSEKVDLIKVKGTQLDIIEHARDDDESVESAKTLKRREKLLKEMEILATTGVDLKSAQKIANLILRVGGFRFRLMLLYIRGLCLVRDRVSRRLADILALAPVV